MGGGRLGARPARQSDRASARLPHTPTGVVRDGARRVASREGVLPDAAPLLQAGTFLLDSLKQIQYFISLSVFAADLKGLQADRLRKACL